MKASIVITALFLFFGTFHSAFAQSKELELDTASVYSVVEQMPEFSGGMEKMNAYIFKAIKYPASEVEAKNQGNVFVQFIVNTFGELTSFEVVKGQTEALNAEALRVVKSMPKWKPGKQNGKLVKVKCVIPIEFKLVPERKRYIH
jgi:protein TonB